VVNPSDSVCYQVPVPNDRQHIAAFMGAIYGLSKPYEWQNDAAHTALQVGVVWRRIFDNLQKCADNTGNSCSFGADIGEALIRQNPDNPCEIQSSADGNTWCTFIDLSLCLTGGQPGAGSPQPSPDGGTACYTGKLQANGVVLLPTVVNTGDIITVNNFSGAGTDGTAQWFCPDGSIFFLGACAGPSGLNGSDPLPTAQHMSILAKIDGVYYPLAEVGAITVGASVVNQQVTLQVNDSSLGDNYGEYTFNVCVQNNQETTWTHELKFDLSANSFVNWNDLVSSGTPGTWTPGTGWIASTIYQGSSGEYFRTVRIKRTGITPFKFRGATVVGDMTKGGFVGSGEYGVNVQVGVAGSYTSVVSVANSAMSDGSNQSWPDTASINGVDELRVVLTCSTSSPGDTTSGGDTVIKLIVTGEGSDPF
jgi:hypothetical protein